MSRLGKRIRRHDFPSCILLLLLLSSVLLSLLGWLGNTVGLPFRNLFSAEGTRWYYLHVADCFHSSVTTVSVPLLLMAGAMERSGLAGAVRGIMKHGMMVLTYRQRKAFWISLTFLVYYCAVLVFLLVGPYDILCSVTGRIFPSPYVSGFLQSVPAGFILMSLLYGVVSYHLRGLHECLSVFYWGLRRYAMVLLMLWLAVTSYHSFVYVAGDALAEWMGFLNE